ncbi:protein of unknown function [Pseudomonas mediterranea]
MIQISALPAFTDNYIWLLQDHASRRCAVVDPGDAAPVQAWLEAHPGWVLSDILITHHHHDHVGGVQTLKNATNATVHGPASEEHPGAGRGAQGQRPGRRCSAWTSMSTPCPAISFWGILPITTMVCCSAATPCSPAGCGRLLRRHAGAGVHHSLGRLAALPDDTLVYCTHEYTLSNLKFAAAVEHGQPGHRRPPGKSRPATRSRAVDDPAVDPGPGKTHQSVPAHH